MKAGDKVKITKVNSFYRTKERDESPGKDGVIINQIEGVGRGHAGWAMFAVSVEGREISLYESELELVTRPISEILNAANIGDPISDADLAKGIKFLERISADAGELDLRFSFFKRELRHMLDTLASYRDSRKRNDSA